MFEQSVFPLKDFGAILVLTMVLHDLASVLQAAMSAQITFAVVSGEFGVAFFEGAVQNVGGGISICRRWRIGDPRACVRMEPVRCEPVQCQTIGCTLKQNVSLPGSGIGSTQIYEHRSALPYRPPWYGLFRHLICMANCMRSLRLDSLQRLGWDDSRMAAVH